MLEFPEDSGHCLPWAVSGYIAARLLGAAVDELQVFGGGANFRIHTVEEGERDLTMDTHFGYVADAGLKVSALHQHWSHNDCLPEMHCWLTFTPRGSNEIWLYDPTSHRQAEQAVKLLKATPTYRINEPLWLPVHELLNSSEDSPAYYTPSVTHTVFAHLVTTLMLAKCKASGPAVTWWAEAQKHIPAFLTNLTKRLHEH